MKPLTIAPPASYSPDYKSAPMAPMAPSAQPPPEPQGQRERSGLATGSLPVSSVETLIEKWEKRAFNERVAESTAHTWSQCHKARARDEAIRACVDDLRREMARATERQPEENTNAQPAAELPGGTHSP